MEPREVYLDNSATTRVDPRVTEAMLPYFSERYGNPNSLHRLGREARDAVDAARAKVAALINAEPTDIIFTGAGSEADNLAIKGAAWALRERGKGNHIITSAIEHHAILDTVKWLGKMGFEYTILPVDGRGMVSPEELEKAIRPDTILATIMAANNEIGTIQPVRALGEVCRAHGVMFHTDGVQAAGHIKMDVKELPVDMMTMAAHKMYGPKGLGALYVRRGTRIKPFVIGGHQERGRRGGTENVPYIIGLAKACDLAQQALTDGTEERMRRLRDKLQAGLLASCPDSRVNGGGAARVSNTLNISFEYIEGESVLYHLSDLGICASSGSACAAGSLEPSHVIRAMGVPFTAVHGSIRFSLSRYTTEEEIDYVLAHCPEVVAEMRAISPFVKR